MKKITDQVDLILVIVPVRNDADKLNDAKIASRHSNAYVNNWDNVFGNKKNSDLN